MIHLEPVRWDLRGRAGEFRYGDRYDIAATVQTVIPGVALLSSMVGRAHSGMRSEIGEGLAALGFKCALWVDAEGRIRLVDLRPYRKRALSC